MATVMNEKIQQISEDYINGMLEIITKAINEKVDAIELEDHLNESDIRSIAADEARDVVNDASVEISV